MLVTEDEAKTKWCSQARATTGSSTGRNSIDVASGAPAVNRIGVRDAPDTIVIPWGCYCLASGCMAWRWGPGPIETNGDPSDISRPPPLLHRLPPTHGYCGLAGRPA